MFDDMQEVLMGTQYRKVDNLVWSMPDGNIGIKSDSGIIALDKDNNLTRNPSGMFSMSLPAFAFATKLEDVQKGDIIVNHNGSILGWIMKNKDGKFKILDEEGFTKDWKPVNTKMFGFESNGPMVVKSIMSLNGGSLDGTGFNQGNMMNMLMLQKMMGNDSDSFDKIIPLMAISGGMSSGNGDSMNIMNMVMMESLMDESSDMSDLLPFMAMSGNQGGAGIGNNMTQLMMMSKLFSKDKQGNNGIAKKNTKLLNSMGDGNWGGTS